MRRVAPALPVAAAVLGIATTSPAAPLPRLFGRPVLDRTEYAFNAGDLQRVATPEWVPVAQRGGVRVWVWNDRNWMNPARAGSFVAPADAVAEGAPLKDAYDVFRAPIDAEDGDEWIWVPRQPAGRGGRVLAPTIVHRDARGKWTVAWRPTALPGLRYRLEDARDMNGDGRYEVVLSGQFGSNGYYTSYAVIGVAGNGAWRVLVTTPPDTLHLHDADRDGAFEIVVQHLVSRRGPVSQWVTTDRVYRWTGAVFERDPIDVAPMWYAQVTARRLLDELIDHFDVDSFLLHTRLEVLRQVHAHVLDLAPPRLGGMDPVRRAARLERAGRWQQATTVLRRALERNPWDVQVLRRLLRYHLGWQRWGDALELAYRVLGIDPDDGAAWTAAGVCFGTRGDRSEAMAAFVLAVRLSEDGRARRAHLVALRRRVRSPVLRVALDRALAWLDAHPDRGDEELSAPGEGGAPSGPDATTASP